MYVLQCAAVGYVHLCMHVDICMHKHIVILNVCMHKHQSTCHEVMYADICIHTYI